MHVKCKMKFYNSNNKIYPRTLELDKVFKRKQISIDKKQRNSIIKILRKSTVSLFFIIVYVVFRIVYLALSKR